jgi:hypothetical protein
MRSPRRALAHLLVAAGLAGGLGALAAACGTDAVGVDACKQIELARCDVAPVCKADFDVDHCHAVYRDQCLHGIENVDHPPSDAEVSDCVAAIQAVAGCARRGDANMSVCPVPVVNTVLPATLSPCDVILSNAHLLERCSFAATPSDAGAIVTAAPDASDASDASDDGAAADAGASDAAAADAAAGDAAADAG